MALAFILCPAEDAVPSYFLYNLQKQVSNQEMRNFAVIEAKKEAFIKLLNQLACGSKFIIALNNVVLIIYEVSLTNFCYKKDGNRQGPSNLNRSMIFSSGIS